MSTWQQNFNQIRENKNTIFDALERAMMKTGVDFYLIGAQSRDVWTNHLDLKGKRTTNDIDYMVYVKNKEIWEALINYLITTEGFHPDKELPYRFDNNGVMDLIPFGGMETDDEVILENPFIELSVFGCKEVAENESIVEGKFKIITLAGLCILKLVAYDEKPDGRAKDFDDFLFVVSNYHEIAGNELFTGEFDDLLQNEFEYTIAAARMLGRQMERTLSKNERLGGRIKAVLHRKLQGYDFGEIDNMYACDKSDKLILQFKLIAETLKGINDNQ